MIKFYKSCAKAAVCAAAFLAFLPIGVLIGIATVPVRADAAVTDWQKAVSIAPRWNTDFTSDSFKQSVRNAQAMGASTISLVIPWSQSNNTSSDIQRSWNSPSDDTLGQAIDFIHDLGMKVILKPHLESGTGDWRALIDARDRNSWYANYSSLLNSLGDLGRAHGAEEIVVGTELISMSSPYMNPDNTQRWQTMIASLRTHYSGKLTYSANWGVGNNWTNEFEKIAFWGQLDYIGISAYFQLGGSSDYSVSTLKNGWSTVERVQIQPLQAKYGKPVLFTEVGYKSVDGANTQPWNHDLSGNYNAQMQVNLYQALFEFWNTKSYMAGAMLWDWNSDPNYGGQGNIDYTPQNKPAEATIRTWWKTAGTPTPIPTPTPQPAPQPSSSSGTISSSAQAPSNMQPGNSASIPVTVSTTGQAQNVIIDIEIYDPSSAKIVQQFFENQSISQTSPAQFSIIWTPPATGTYVLKVGVFKSDWSANYHWNNDVADMVVAAPGQTPPPNPAPQPNPQPTPTSTSSPAVTDIWWPSDGSTINGLQPFKAMIENKSVGDYTMSWRVEGGAENTMYDNSQDWPHKESLVDVSGWTWKGNDPYKVDFISKDSSGNIISQKSVNIYVK